MILRSPNFRVAIATALFAVAIFVADMIAPRNVATNALYVGVVILSARFCTARGVMLVCAGCLSMTVLSWFLAPDTRGLLFVGVANLFISMAAITLTTVLVVQSQSVGETLQERAKLLDLTHDTVFSRDISGIITYWNRGAEELYGWSTAEAVGTSAHRLLETTFPAPLDEINAELLRTGRWEGELVHKKQDGSRVVVASRWALKRNERGRPAAILETNNDITEHKQTQESLRQTQVELARVARVTMLGELTAAIAHEVGQPLTGLVSSGSACLRWLGGETPDLELARRAVERMINDGVRAGEVLNQMRALVRKSPPQKEHLNVNEPITEVITLIRSEVQRNRIFLRTELSEELPLVLADRIQLQQVILNLIMNAIEAMTGIAGGQRELSVASAKDELNAVLVTVRDSGPGLDGTALERLFDAFYTTKPDGMGMGLAISRTIIKAHGGKLWATPNVPKGAIFQFRLPTDGEEAP